MDPRWPSKSKLYVFGIDHNSRMQKFGIISIPIIFIFVLIGGCFWLSPRLAYNVEKSSSYFTVLVDCGSTGTRVNIYEWRSQGRLNNGDLPILLNTFPENLTRTSGMHSEPGLDKFVGNVSGVRASLDPLIHWAEGVVPRERWEFTPIFVLATAGMRRLPLDDAKQILEDIAEVVKGFGFVYKKDWIRVLSGKEEAYYGWIALNYKMGMLGNSLRSHTLGLLDLGGSSLQVVSEVDESKNDNHALRSKVGSAEHEILAYSLPAFGLNEAFDRTVVFLSHTPALRESSDGTFEVRHPCLGHGFVQNYTCLSCFQQPISSDLGSQININSILLLGEPNWEICKSLARAVATNLSNADWSLVHDHESCSGLHSNSGNELLNLMLNSTAVTRYHALSGFFAVYQMLNLSSRANLTRMWETGQQVCSQSWEDHGGIGGAYCFRVLYMASLIQDALCLNKREIIFGPGDVSWTLGAAIIEGQYLWSDATKHQNDIFSMKHSNKMLSSSVALFLLLLCLLLIVYRSQIKLPMPGRKPTASKLSLPTYLCSKRQPN